ncbi:magnesium-dependent phosphatase-1 [Thermococcus atlanticus]
MKLLVLDLDGTLWDHEDASRLVPPFLVSSDGEGVVDAYGEELVLFPGVRDFLEWAKERFLLSVASWNLEEFVRPILEALGLWDYFVFPKIEGHPDKASMIERTLLELKAAGYTVDGVIYVDDRTIHVDEVVNAIPDLKFIHMWTDVKSFEELKKMLEVL